MGMRMELKHPSPVLALSKLKLTTLLPGSGTYSHCLGFILFLYSCVYLSSSLTNACKLMYDEWEEKTVEERTMLADAVVSGRVLRQVHPSVRNKTDFMYAVDVEILEIYKGYRHFTNVSSLGSPLQASNVFRILGFGERKRCFSEAHEDEEYIFFLTPYSMPNDAMAQGNTAGMGLSAKYDDFYGALVRMNKKHEEQVLSTLGWQLWSSWSTCPVSCGGGQQNRRRVCVKDVADACEGSAEQRRNCNEFGCTGMRNLLQILPLAFFPKGVRRTPVRWQSYRLRAFANLRTETTTVFPHGFPQEFSVIMSVRPKYTRKNDGDLYILVITDQEGRIEFGIKFDDVPAVVYSERVGESKIQHSQAFPEYKITRDWHTMAFSVRGSSVSLHVDCSTVIKHELESPITVDSRGVTSIGSPTAKSREIYFEGDVEQLVLIGDPDAAELQCVEPTNLIPTLSSASWAASNSPWNLQSDAAVPYHLLIPPPHFKTWEDGIPTTKPPVVTTTTSSPTTLTTTPTETTTDTNVRWDGGGGHDMWFAITLPPHLATNLIPLAREIETNALTPASGTVDINLLPPPDTNEPFIPKPPASLVGDNPLLPDIGVPSKLISVGEASGDNNGFGELLSGVTGQNSDKNIFPGGDGGHDVPFDVTLPQQNNWARGDAPPEGYIPPPRTTVRIPETTVDVSTTSPDFDIYPDYLDFSSALPASLPASSTESSSTTVDTTTKLPTTTAVPDVPTIKLPTTTAIPDVPTTTLKAKKPTTTKIADVLNNAINDKILATTKTHLETTKNVEFNNILATTPKAQLQTTTELEFNNVLLNDAGVQDLSQPRPALDSSEDEDDINWSTWSTCSKSCDTGIRYRFTFCTQDSTLPDCIARGGRGVASETKICHVRDCDAAPRIRWSEWSECSRSCGEGLQTRMALCVGRPTIPECIGRRTAVQRKPCTGNQCEGVCSPSCQNGGNCETDGSCTCRSGFSGPQCQIRLWSYSRCNPQCANGGTCVSSAIPPRCACRQGYTGQACETAMCRQGCRNGGRCVAPDTCNCPSRYQGSDCSQPICRSRCQNGGDCVRPDVCRCPRGYRGPHCQQFYCRQRCRNGGRCVGPDKCSCLPGFTGEVCQTSSCYGGCPEGSRCVAPGRCATVGTGRGGMGNSYQMSSYSKNCRLTSYTGSYSQSYVKPEIKTTRTRCGPYLRSVCPRTSIQYTRSYRTSYKTFYRMTCQEPT